MGTMSNTLILAYVGSSLNLLLLFTTYDIPLNEIIGRDNLAAEIVRALAGSVGLIATIPLTALIAALLAEKSSPRTCVACRITRWFNNPFKQCSGTGSLDTSLSYAAWRISSGDLKPFFSIRHLLL